ncbi:DNA-binding response OmpR family regulator [Bacillus ectoiniformans]|uniref:response regulator transcription factor n=1 Tax=Bacillus ectoiniformans TaxID=1494429 RepID=UPI00195C167A|nr:response regulator transcription factor [Bacillus ectoiniformans]MBM7647597.1 DNA-binding response OmpR family regulator [Bacillus ectoiniformans]
MPHILIVDDEEDMRHLISMYLENAGFTVTQAGDERQAKERLKEENIDLVLLDVMLPGKSGFEICADIRASNGVPIIFLTAKGEEWDKVKGLQLGGDDYIVKPFSPGELTARIQAVLRRFPFMKKEENSIKKAGVHLDLHSHSVKVNGRSITLTLKEFDLLLILLKNAGRVFSREQLLVSIWGEEYSGGTRTVDTHVKTLRMKLGKEAGAQIVTVWGIGYKFEESSP